MIIFLPLLQSGAARLAAIDYVVLALYFLVIFAIGWYFSRRERTTTDYFLASRDVACYSRSRARYRSRY
ncbi:MAG: hypothetical protein ACREA2_15610 [Blastocatellia bacterium]